MPCNFSRNSQEKNEYYKKENVPILPIVASNLRLMEICARYAQFCLNYYKIMPCVFDPSLVKYLRIDMSGAFVLKKFADFLAHIKLNTKD